MKHCSAIVLYKSTSNQLQRIRVCEKYTNVFQYDILNYELYDTKPYRHESFNDMYSTVLNLLRTHNLKPYSYYQFGALVYDITFIDIDTLEFNRYPHFEEKR